jgi:hypothetical protein
MMKFRLLTIVFFACILNAFGQQVIYETETNFGFPNIKSFYLYDGDQINFTITLTKGKNLPSIGFYKGIVSVSPEILEIFSHKSSTGFTENFTISENGPYSMYYETAFFRNAKIVITRSPDSEKKAGYPTSIYHNTNRGYYPGDYRLTKDQVQAISPNKGIVLFDSVVKINNTALENRLQNDFPLELAYKLNKGDTCVFEFKVLDGAELHTVEVYENHTDLGMVYSRKAERIGEDKMGFVVNEPGIYSFKFDNMWGMGALNADISIKRIPGAGSSKDFDTRVSWKTEMVEVTYGNGSTKQWPKKVPVID